MIFLDRREAGRRLATRIEGLRIKRPVVVALPPGGLRIGYEIATRLKASMDILAAEEVLIPGSAGATVGAVADGRFYPNETTIRRYRVSREYAERLASIEEHLEELLEHACRHGVPPVDLTGCQVILVDDGSTSAAAADAAVQTVKARDAAGVMYASPIISPAVFTRLVEQVELVTLCEPGDYRSMRVWDEGFEQTTENEAAALIARTRDAWEAEPNRLSSAPPAAGASA